MTAGDGRHVLIVEDSEEVVLALQIVMEAAGYRVSTAATVEEAVGIGREQPVDVLLLDLTLPDGNGLEVLRRLADAGASPRDALALTGRDEPEVRERCLAAGCRDVMVKPVPVRELVRRVGEK